MPAAMRALVKVVALALEGIMGVGFKHGLNAGASGARRGMSGWHNLFV
jgi:hypothetical protein